MKKLVCLVLILKNILINLKFLLPKRDDQCQIYRSTADHNDKSLSGGPIKFRKGKITLFSFIFSSPARSAQSYCCHLGLPRLRVRPRPRPRHTFGQSF